MSGIGPQIPAHLLNDKSVESDEDNKLSSNQSVAGIGPELPPHLQAGPSKPDHAPVTVGPQIPPEFLNRNPPSEEEDEEDEYAPALPPDLLAARSGGQSVSKPPTSGPSSGPSSDRRQVGPTMPTYAPTYDPQSYYSDDDDDDVGPKPLPPGMHHQEKDAVQEFMEKEERRRKQIEEASKPKAPKRDEWMLVPPSSSDLLSKLDPTKLKGRQFSRSAAPSRGQQDNSLWTETPAERQQRLADEVSGKKRRAAEPVPVDEFEEQGKRKRRRDDEIIRKGVDEYTQNKRGPALIEQHASSRKPDEDKKDDGIWDHSRDMALGGRLMDDSKRNKFVQEAKGLGDRFGTGKSGGFL